MKIFDASISGSLQIPNYPSNPTGLASGSMYFNTTDSTVYQYNGSSWVQVGSSASAANAITTGSISTTQSITGSLNVSNSLNIIGGNTKITGALLISGSNDITGTFSVGIGGSRDFLVFGGGVNIGNSLTDTHTVTGSLLLSGSGNITGTFTVGTGGSRDFQVLSTGVAIGNAITDVHTLTGSLNVTGSIVDIGTLGVTGSLGVSGSQVIYGSGSALFTIDGSVGRLFQVDDSLSGSLYSVNTIAGLPIIEAFSDNTVRIGQYGNKALFVSQSKVGFGKETSLNGIVDVSGNTTMTGSLLVSGSSDITGSFSVGTGGNRDLLVLSSGVNIGNAASDYHTVTGSLDVSGSMTSYLNPYIAATPSGSISITSTSLTDVSGMTLNVRGGSYIIDTWLFGQSSSIAGAAFAVSASGTITGFEVVQSGQLSTTTFGATALQTVNNTAGTTFMTTANAECWIHLTGRITTTTTGNIVVRAQKLTSGTLTLRNSSYMALTRIT